MSGLQSESGNPLLPLLRLAETAHLARSAVIEASALLLVRQIKLELSTPGRGRLRRRGKLIRGKKGGKGRNAYRTSIAKLDRASAPGDPPAVDTGALRNSIGYERYGIDNHRVGTGQEYAPPLEFGAKLPNGGEILPRPFMRPAVEKVKDAMGAVASFELRTVTRRAFPNG